MEIDHGRLKYDDGKDHPEAALYMLALMLRLYVWGAEADERYAKGLYLLKTMGLAAGIPEGRINRLIAEAMGGAD
jgi:hypothetical protein